MLSPQKTILAINEYKAKLFEWVMGPFNTMILLVDPYNDFMQVMSIALPTGVNVKYIRPDGDYSPPIFTKESALESLQTFLQGWQDHLVIITFNDNTAETLFTGSAVLEHCNKVLEHSVKCVDIQPVKSTVEYPGYQNLPTLSSTPRFAKRISPQEKLQRNKDIVDFYNAGISYKEIAQLVGLSPAYVYSIVKRGEN